MSVRYERHATLKNRFIAVDLLSWQYDDPVNSILATAGSSNIYCWNLSWNRNPFYYDEVQISPGQEMKLDSVVSGAFGQIL